MIILNAVVLGMEISATLKAQFGPLLLWLDAACLAGFVVELALKLIIYRTRFFTNNWNLFDFSIVGITLLPDNGALSLLRMLRVLRIISVSSNLRKLAERRISALPSMASV